MGESPLSHLRRKTGTKLTGLTLEQLLNDLSNLSFIIIIIILTTVQEMKAVITPALNRKALLFCLQAGHSRFLKLIYDSLDFG